MKRNTLPSSPFVGLRPFQDYESPLFFGRHEQNFDLLQKLHETQFLAVVGSSGSGKSSLIRAGLIPKLKAGFLVQDRDRWHVVVMQPGDSPLHNLATKILDINSDNTLQLADFLDDLDIRGTQAIVDNLAPILKGSTANLLLLVDQFEEIFRFGINPENQERRDEAANFVAIMLGLAEQHRLPIYVVMTMRSDFLGSCDVFYGLPEALNRSQYLVPRLTRQQRREAIEGPIRLYGETITPRLVNRVLNDVSDEQDQLPVLQHALMRIWNYWEEGHTNNESIDLQHYEAIGGTLRKALDRHAEEACNELGSDRSKEIAEKLFKALTDVDPEGKRVRRPVQIKEICAITGADPAEVIQVIDRFRQPPRSFLMPPAGIELDNDSIIDISHESLIRVWDRLGRWVDEEAESAQFYQRLAEAAKLHETGKTALWQDPDLTLAIEWREKNRPTKHWAQRYDPAFDRAMDFLDKSKDKWERDKREKEEAHRKELRRAWIVTLSFFLTTLVALLFSLYTWQLKNEAKRQAKLVEASSLLNTVELIQDPLIQALLLTEMKGFEEPPGGVRIASQVSNQVIPLRVLPWTENNKNGCDLRLMIASDSNPEDKIIDEFEMEFKSKKNQCAVLIVRATSDSDRWTIAGFNDAGDFRTEVIDNPHHNLWKELKKEPQEESRITKLALSSLDRTHKNNSDEVSIFSADFSSDGSQIVAGGADGTVRIWRTDGNGEPVVLGRHKVEVRSVDFSPSDSQVVSGSVDGKVRIWRADGNGESELLGEHDGPVWSVHFSPSGSQVVSGGSDGKVRIWQSDGNGEPVVLGKHDGPVWSVHFSPSGSQVVSGGSDGKVRIWQSDGNGEPVVLRGHKGTVWSVNFSPDGLQVASAGDDRIIRLWHLKSNSKKELFGPENKVLSIGFNQNASQVVGGSEDGTIWIWKLGSSEQKNFFGHKGRVWSVNFSQDGSRLLSAGQDGTIRIWPSNLSAGGEVLGSHKHHKVLSVAFSSDGSQVVSGGDDGMVRIWQFDGSREQVSLGQFETSRLLSTDFSPDGSQVVSGSDDGKVQIWRLNSSDGPMTLGEHKGKVWSVDFSPDGSQVVSGGEDGMVRIWQSDGSGEVWDLDRHYDEVYSVSFNPCDESQVVSGGKDGQDGMVRLWRLDGSGKPEVLGKQAVSVWSIAFSPDGSQVVSGGADGEVWIWQSDGNGKLIGAHKGGSRVQSVGFNPDGTRVVSSSGEDEIIYIWRVDGSDDEPIVMALANQTIVWSVDFHPNGQWIVSGNDDGTVRRWPFGWTALLEHLEEKTKGLCLTKKERKKYLKESAAEADSVYNNCQEKI